MFLIIDYTGDMWKYVPNVERYLRDLVEQLRQDKLWPQIELSIVGMGGVTGPLRTEDILKGPTGRLARILPICNLSMALKSVVRALSGRVTNYQVKGEVFVILGNKPGVQRWEEYAQQLDGLGVNITPIAFAFMSRSPTQNLLEKLKTATGKLIRFEGNVSGDKLRWLFLEAMVSQIKGSLATRTIVAEAVLPAISARGRAPGADKEGQSPEQAIAASPPPEKPVRGHSANHIAIKLSGKGPSPVGTVPPKQAQQAQGERGIVPDTVKGKATRLGVAAIPTPRSKVVDSQDVTSNWQESGPTDPIDPAPNEMVDREDATGRWRIVGASRCGKVHAGKGSCRKDAFALGAAGSWHLMVVADGGGAGHLSHVGSQLAADTAVTTMAKWIKLMAGNALADEEVCEIALRKGLEEAWKKLSDEADSRQVSLGHLGTTLLSVIHRPDESGSIVGIAQIGDGLVAAELADGEIVRLAEPDVDEAASVPLLLTSEHWKEWLDRVNVWHIETSPRLLAAMCDGVAVDLVPFEQHLPALFETLRQKVLSELEQPEQALLDLLAYREGSSDDRTVTLLYRIEHGEEK